MKKAQRGQSLRYDNIQETLDASPDALRVGNQQFETPRAVAEILALPLPPYRPVICDLQCARGNLLAAAKNDSTKHCLGVEHPETARTAENLAFVYVQQGRYTRAEPLLYRALFTHVQQSGLESPDTAYPLFGLAELWRLQKKYRQSEALHQHVLTLRQQQLGTEHLDTAESLQGLGDLYRACERYDDAASCYEQALAIREKILQWESPSMLESCKAYADMQRVLSQGIRDI